MDLTFWCDGDPRPEPRPRAFVLPTGRVSVHCDKSIRDWRTALMLASARLRPREPIADPVTVCIVFYMRRPQRLCGPRHVDGPIAHAAKPDLDNLAKPVLDALTKTQWWVDDSQVVSMWVSKYYCSKGARPGCRVVVQPEPPPPDRATVHCVGDNTAGGGSCHDQ
jgi:Holliday junction resolvase RusA-like endonuclease